MGASSGYLEVHEAGKQLGIWRCRRQTVGASSGRCGETSGCRFIYPKKCYCMHYCTQHTPILGCVKFHAIAKNGSWELNFKLSQEVKSIIKTC